MTILRKNMTKNEYLRIQLERALKRSSKGRMPKKARKALALRTIQRLDMNNTYQMHKSLEGYADILTANYFK